MGKEKKLEDRNLVWGNEHHRFHESPQNTMTGSHNKDELGQETQEDGEHRGFGDQKEKSTKTGMDGKVRKDLLWEGI